MHIARSTCCISLLCSALLAAGCNRDVTPSEAKAPDIEPTSGVLGTRADRLATDEAESVIAAIFGNGELPYPVYPNGTRYRVGGENGLNIVVYQTEDQFSDVDGYYSEIAAEGGLERLSGMNDYVRYSLEESDTDPFGTHRPGIVIHEFNDDMEREAMGASPKALTNIIMSFQAN